MKHTSFPLSSLSGGESLGVGWGVRWTHQRYNSIVSQSVVSVISVESHNICWTLTSPKFSNHDAQPFTTEVLKFLQTFELSMFELPQNSPRCTEFLSHDVCFGTMSHKGCVNHVPQKFGRCTSTMFELHAMESSQVCRVLKPRCSSLSYVPTKFVRCIEFLSHSAWTMHQWLSNLFILTCKARLFR